MSATRSRSTTLAGGYRLDPDLPAPPDDDRSTLGGLHVLRHLQRHLDTLGLHLVIFSDPRYSELMHQLTGDYELSELDEHRELRRYRFASSPSRMRDVLRTDTHAVPLVGFTGSTCVGRGEPDWSGVRLARYFRPGQLFAFRMQFTSMFQPRPGAPTRLHLAEWQAPFPTHSVATWGNQAKLLRGPQEIDRPEIAGYMFDTGSEITNAPEDRRRYHRWCDSVAQRVGETAHPVGDDGE